MAKANITMKNGTTIAIEGNAEEVGLLIDRFSGLGEALIKSETAQRTAPAKKNSVSKARAKSGPKPRIVELIEEEFFTKPKGLGELKDELEARGHFYEMNALSTPILRLVKSRALRRIKDKAYGSTSTLRGLMSAFSRLKATSIFSIYQPRLYPGANLNVGLARAGWCKG